MDLLQVQNVSFEYPDSNVKALDNVSFSVQKGEYAVILGSNGSGKSTVTRIICGFIDGYQGHVKLQDGARTGIVFQSPKDQIVSGIVSRDTEFGPENLKLTPAEIEQRTIESLAVTGLLDRAMDRSNALSLGQTQKLALSGIIALRPDLLILDEATSMLDPASRSELLEFIDYSNEHGQSILHITHDIDEAYRADHVIALHNGKLIFDGSQKQFRDNSSLVKELFGEPVQKSDRAFDLKNAADGLVLEDIHFKYENTEVLKGINLTLKKGSLTALTGASGCGKSTLLEIASGLLQSTKGKVFCDDRPALALQDAGAAIFERYAADDVAFGAKNKGFSSRELVQKVQESMDIAGLPFKEFKDRPSVMLSGGQKRKLSIAGIIAMDSSVLLFDEPSAGLDANSRRELLSTLKKLAQSGKTVLFSTHRMDEADFADRHIAIENGIIVKDSDCKADREVESITSLPEQKCLEGAGLLSLIRKTSELTVNNSKKSNTLLSRINPVGKYLLFFTLFILGLCSKNVLFALFMAGMALCYAKSGNYSFKKLGATFLVILPWLLLFCLMELFFYPVPEGELPVYKTSHITLYLTNINLSILTLVRAFTAYSVVQIFIFTTGEKELLEGFSGLLMLFTMLHINIRSLVVVVEIIFRFVPLLIDEASGIIKTQLVRGALGKTKGIFGKIKLIIPLFVPLIIQTIKRTEILADALTARYF